MEPQCMCPQSSTCLRLMLLAIVILPLAGANTTIATVSPERPSRSLRKYTGAPERRLPALRYSDPQAHEPKGDKCDGKLFYGEFACCWTVKRVAASYYAIYRYVCDSEPDNKDCGLATKPPSYSMSVKVMDPYTCIRSITKTFAYGLMVQFEADANVSLQVYLNSADQMLVGVRRGLVTCLGLTESSIEIIDGPDVYMGNETGTGILNVTLQFVEDQELRERYDVAMLDDDDGDNTSELHVTVRNTERALAGESDALMRSESFRGNVTQAIQLLGGSFAGVIIRNVTVEKYEKMVWGQAMVDKARTDGAALLVWLAILVAISLTSNP